MFVWSMIEIAFWISTDDEIIWTQLAKVLLQDNCKKHLLLQVCRNISFLTYCKCLEWSEQIVAGVSFVVYVCVCERERVFKCMYDSLGVCETECACVCTYKTFLSWTDYYFFVHALWWFISCCMLSVELKILNVKALWILFAPFHVY